MSTYSKVIDELEMEDRLIYLRGLLLSTHVAYVGDKVCEIIHSQNTSVEDIEYGLTINQINEVVNENFEECFKTTDFDTIFRQWLSLANGFMDPPVSFEEIKCIDTGYNGKSIQCLSKKDITCFRRRVFHYVLDNEDVCALSN